MSRKNWDAVFLRDVFSLRLAPIIRGEDHLFKACAERNFQIMKLLVAIGILLTTTTLHAIPWLIEDTAWCGLLAIACGLFLVTRTGYLASFWVTWLWCTAAIGAAFHWSPAAMAYTLSSDYWLGFLVAMPLVLWDGLRLALGYWLGARLSHDIRSIWFSAALTTIACEFLMPSVFPWRLGFMLLSWPWATQAVDIFGPAWPTFFAFASAGLIIVISKLLISRFYLDQNQPEISAAPLRVNRVAWASLPIVGFNLMYSLWALNYWQAQIDAAPKTRVALVQVDPSFVVSLEQSRALTASVAKDVDIVCWPESSGGNYELSLDELSDENRVFDCSREPERGLRPWPSPTCELLLGGKNYVGDRDTPDAVYVCAMLIDEKEKITARYNKRYLMPFGEYVPFEGTVPGLAALFDMAEHMTPGSGAVVLKSRTGARLGAMLCYEDMVPEASRQMVLGGANLLVSLVNGSAFESRHTLAQHRLLSQLRSLECRRYYLRCAATGETCVISPFGDIVTRLPLQQNGVLKWEVALLQGTTVYSLVPWMAPTLCLIGILIQISIVVHNRKAGAKLQSADSLTILNAESTPSFSGTAVRIPIDCHS